MRAVRRHGRGGAGYGGGPVAPPHRPHPVTGPGRGRRVGAPVSAGNHP
ncbi:hypothetical protein SAMN06297387_11151 [Streptomyces zhaozhouensis]|uniref:Uncharacterized protein n=1 Tax=Streptomyces zhaozhouensis TaxID=1300267 RepID=A0A286DY77_9ACTN|nr:hypothetical protein SAMN06297387_11151 [Streptomyces zhaozhouensis]